MGGYPLSIALENGAEDDTKMQILAKANTAEFGKKVVTDGITITAIYPDGSKTIFQMVYYLSLLMVNLLQWWKYRSTYL